MHNVRILEAPSFICYCSWNENSKLCNQKNFTIAYCLIRFGIYPPMVEFSNFDLSVWFSVPFFYSEERNQRAPLGDGKVSIKRKLQKQRTSKLLGFRLISTSPPPQNPSLSAGIRPRQEFGILSRGRPFSAFDP